MLLFLIGFIITCFAISVSTQPIPINITSNEQYTCVLRSEEYVDYFGNVGQTPSLFIGLIFISVISLDPPTIQTVLWHQVSFAVNATINGPVDPNGGTNPASVLLPLITLASTNAAAGSANCPITGTWIVDDFFMDYLRSSRLLCQIESGTNTGNLRGQIFSKYTPASGRATYRRDAFVAFLGPMAENGMAVFRAHVLPPPAAPNSLVYLDYWILSKISSASAVFQAIQAGNGYLPVALFEANPDPDADNSILVKRWISLPELGPVVPYSMAITGNPIFGPGSSNLILTVLDADLINTFTSFYRLAYYTDMDVFKSNTSSTTLPHVDFTSSSLFYSLLASAFIAVLFVFFMIYVYFKSKSKR